MKKTNKSPVVDVDFNKNEILIVFNDKEQYDKFKKGEFIKL